MIKSIETCYTNASTPMKGLKEITSASTISNSNQKKRSLTVYSALKNVVNQIDSFELENDQLHKPKTHLTLTQSKLGHVGKGKVKSTREISETGEVMMKMNLCGPKFCQISIENPYKFLYEQQSQNQDHQKKHRVLYESKKQDFELQENLINNTIETKLNDFPKRKLNGRLNKIKNSKNAINSSQNQSLETSFQKKQQNQNISNDLNLQEVQKQVDDQMILAQEISHISKKKQTKIFSKQGNSKSDSFSIRQFSSSHNPFQMQSQHHSHALNFEKLKQIYRNSLKSELSAQQSRVITFDPEKFQTEGTKNLFSKKLTIDFQKINKNEDPQNTNGPYPAGHRDSTRTIIELLNDWDTNRDQQHANLYPIEQSKITINQQKTLAINEEQHKIY